MYAVSYRRELIFLCLHDYQILRTEMLCLYFVRFMWPCIETNFFLIKTTRRTNVPNFILSKTLHVSGISFAHHQQFSTVHSALVYFLQFWWQLPSRVRMELQLTPHTRNLLRGAESLLRSWQFLREARNSPHFIKKLNSISVVTTAYNLFIS